MRGRFLSSRGEMARRLDREERCRQATEERLATAQAERWGAQRELDAARLYLALIVEGAGGHVTLPARAIVAAPRLPALAVRHDLDGNVTLSTR